MQLLLYVSPIIFTWIFVKIKSSTLKLIWFPVFFLYCSVAFFIPIAYIFESTFFAGMYFDFMSFFIWSYGFSLFSLFYFISFILINKTTEKKSKMTLIKHNVSSALLYFLTSGFLYQVGVALSSLKI
jgi:hypothetical protein